jgi:hypothetical protein
MPYCPGAAAWWGEGQQLSQEDRITEKSSRTASLQIPQKCPAQEPSNTGPHMCSEGTLEIWDHLGAPRVALPTDIPPVVLLLAPTGHRDVGNIL